MMVILLKDITKKFILVRSHSISKMSTLAAPTFWISTFKFKMVESPHDFLTEETDLVTISFDYLKKIVTFLEKC